MSRSPTPRRRPPSAAPRGRRCARPSRPRAPARRPRARGGSTAPRRPTAATHRARARRGAEPRGATRGRRGPPPGHGVGEEPLDALVVGPVVRGREREAVARPGHALEQVERLGAWRRHVARREGEAELVDELEVRRVHPPDHLPAELDEPAVRRAGLLDAPPDAVPCLEHGHVRARGREVARGGEAGQAGAEDEDVAQLPARTRSASGGRWTVTSSPGRRAAARRRS